MLTDLLKNAGSDLTFTMLEIGALPIGSEKEPFHALLGSWPKSKVVAFEVDAGLCRDLNAKAPRGLQYYSVAVGRSRETRPFYETVHPMCGSLYPPDERYADMFHNLDVMRLKQKGSMDTVPLDAFVEEEHIGPVDFIKMDIQGAELEVLEGAPRVLQNVLAIICEVEFVPLYKEQPLFGEVDAYLRSQGFVFHKFLGLAGRTAKPLVLQNNPNFPVQHLWADAVFIRDPFQLDCLSSEQIQKLALLLDLYGSPDMALALLGKLDKREGTEHSETYLRRLLTNGGPTEGKPQSSKAVFTMVDGVRVVVPDSLELITPYVLIEQQDWFEDEIKFLRKLLRPGQNIIDIGSNYGLYTLSGAHAVGPEGRVWAFEPASATATYLAESISINQFGNIVLEQSALSDSCGSCHLSLNANSELNALVHGDAAAGSSELVRLTTLDTFMNEFGWQHIDFMKMDAEGEESRILKGGKQFFEIHSPLVQYEIKAGVDLHFELVDAFAALGYDSYQLVPGLDMLVPFNAKATPDGYLLNLFCCKRDRAQELAARGFLVLESLDSPFDPPPHQDTYSWRHHLAALPYATQLATTWGQPLSANTGDEVSTALAFYAMSQDASLPASYRFKALQEGFRLLETLCEHNPSCTRLSSLVRVSRDLGNRTGAVSALKRLLKLVQQESALDFGEPFLAPEARFEIISPSASMSNWMLAASLEAFERLAAFSSFYTQSTGLPRLLAISKLGLGSDEMRRRLELVQKRFETNDAHPKPAVPPGPFQPFPVFSELTESRYGNMLYPPKDAFVGRSLKEYGQFNEGEVQLFTHFIAKESVVLDIGANIGAHTIPLAKLVGPGGVVVAFEPQPVLQQFLAANLIINSIPNVITYTMALGNREGECIIPELDYSLAGDFGGISVDMVAEGQAVPIGSLDAFELQRVDFIKLSAEGHESMILEGAIQTIERCQPIMYIKNNHQERSAELIQHLFDLGYRLWWHTPPLFSPNNFKGKKENAFPGIVSINMLAIHRDMRPIEGLRPILSATDTWR